MVNAASTVATVVMGVASRVSDAPLTPSQLATRMLSMITSGSDVIAQQLAAKGILTDGKLLQETCMQFGLLTIGEIGRHDVSSLSIGSSSGSAVCSMLFDACFPLLMHPSEDLKLAASYSIGHLAVGNLDSCLTRLISAITSNMVIFCLSSLML